MSLPAFLRTLLIFSWVSLLALVARAETTLDAPATAASGAKVEVKWTGPVKDSDMLYVLLPNAPDSEYPVPGNAYTFGTSPTQLLTPEPPGEYEIRFIEGGSGAVLARRRIQITPVTATLRAPANVASGNTVVVEVTGPRNEYDTVTIVPVSEPEGNIGPGHNEYVSDRTKVSVKAPEAPGEYEIRYVRGQSRGTLASIKLSIGGTSATLKGPGKAEADSYIKVKWTGPGNEFDQIVIAPKGAPENAWKSSNYVFQKSPTLIRVPIELGAYELRYQTGQSGTTLARDELEVIPAKQETGLLRVTGARNGAPAADGAVEIILDASGSMLQRIGSERRIDIAKQTLTHLTAQVIPARTPFALRVFGREADSCQTDLDIAVSPLDAAAVAQKVAALEAKNGAKTPIGASLAKVAGDLRAVKGERLVILVTDGEETCGGAPRREIEKLRKQGVNVRVNIVGFALEDAKLAATFRQWSAAGNGAYFDARDAQGLKDALTAALRPAYQVTDASKRVVADGVAGGEAVKLMPGTYTVTLKGQKRSQRVTLKAKETASVEF
jgi:hypothetical protein